MKKIFLIVKCGIIVQIMIYLDVWVICTYKVHILCIESLKTQIAEDIIKEI